MKNAHELEVHEIFQQLHTGIKDGLTDTDAALRFKENGPNELKDRGSKKPWKILWEQLSAAMVVILFIAAVISGLLGDFKNASAIAVIVVLNAALGFLQEYKAEKAMAALKKLTVPQVRVRRNGKNKIISARELVPGDIVLLEAGNLVPADCRVLESFNLRLQEAALTGESEPVEKDPKALPGDLPVADKRNMIYMGTLVTYGHGSAVVISTGMKTELGRIASLIQEAGQDFTPLQKRLDKLGKQLALAALFIVAVVFLLGLLRGEDLKHMFMVAVSLAVAAIPEGLPAVVTIALALGAQRMLKRNALIRKLPAVETLGSVTVICSDKTGTLTENRMTVTGIYVADDAAGLTMHDLNTPQKDSVRHHPALNLFVTGSLLCNDAFIEVSADNSETRCALGDPTEAALLFAAEKFGITKEAAEKKFPRVAELPFDSSRKRMTTVHEPHPSALPFSKKRYLLFTKGALDSLINHCSHIWIKDHDEALTEPWRARVHAAHEDLAKKGMRVLALACRTFDFMEKKESWERDQIFIGLVGMIDPARAEAKLAVEICKSAGIKPVMITGDHPLTAQYIGKQLGISEDRAFTGSELEKMPAREAEEKLKTASLYARVSPEHKLKIIEALQSAGHIVAMTGDGVNDAPALKKADIGIAMGITGTDVSKQAADMVLLDDNFATIVTAVKEGRIIFDNIRKFVKYLMTTNSAEILIMLAAPFIGMPLPLLPLQILWINLISDGPSALALGVEPGELDVMKRPPYHPKESVFTRPMIRHIIWVGFFMSFLSLAPGYYYWKAGNADWQTMIFTTLTLSQMTHSLAIRSNRDSLFKIGLFSNRPLIFAVAVNVLLQLAVIYTPFFQNIFKTVPLSLPDLGLCIGLSAILFLAVEAEKGFFRLKSRKGKK